MKFHKLLRITSLVLVLLTAGSILGAQTGPIRAVPFHTICWNEDNPACVHCFADTGAWDPNAACSVRLPAIQDIAQTTVGTRTSCLPSGGKPYYQMQLGCNSPAAANAMAQSLSLLTSGDAGVRALSGASFPRSAWCSETIAYWHRETGIPYDNGYRNGTSFLDWQIPTSYDIQNWYKAERQLRESGGDGRGWWISCRTDSFELDYTTFDLGRTLPVPGAYVRLKGYDPATGGWISDTSHSVMIDEMWIYSTPTGRIVRIRATFLEGNVGQPLPDGTTEAFVIDSREVDDLYTVTPMGTGETWGKRIMGFGVDLDAAGNPIYDPARLHFERVLEIVQGPISRKLPYPSIDWNPNRYEDAADEIAEALASYVLRVQSAGGIGIETDTPFTGSSRLPDGTGSRWIIPKGHAKEIQIAIDLRAVHPLPILGITLQWSGTLPSKPVEVYWADASARPRKASTPTVTDDAIGGRAGNITWPPSAPLPVVFNLAGARVQYVLIVVPANLDQAVVLKELRFSYAWGRDDDVPVELPTQLKW